MPASSSRRSPILSLVIVIVATLIVPAGLRVGDRLQADSHERPSFVPSVAPPRIREPFDEGLARDVRNERPDFVMLGDSLGDVRFDVPAVSRGVGRRGMNLFRPGTPVAYWYLLLKNFVVDNHVPARAAVIVFRDDQLTAQVEVNTLRLDAVARDFEPELDRVWASHRLGPFAGVHRLSQQLYAAERTRAGIEPMLLHMPAALVAADSAPQDLVNRINNEVFPLSSLRRFAAADLAVSTDAGLDFDANVNRSLLPEFIALAERSKMRLAFIRAQRRPLPDGPPPQSAALIRYVERLQEYLEERGCYFVDEWGDTDQPLSIYADGDHFVPQAKAPYTERFIRRHANFFQ